MVTMSLKRSLMSILRTRQLARYTGFTEEEVQEECERYGRDYNRIRDWYDGYEVSDIIPPDPDHKELKATGQAPSAVRYSLYSPLSVVEAMRVMRPSSINSKRLCCCFLLKYWISSR